MSENLDATTTAPQGKGMAVTGFVLALAAFLLNNVMAGIAIVSIGLGGSGWLMYLWLVVNIVSVVLCVMAMGKLKKTGGKRGLAIAGMIIGIVGTVWAIILTMGLAAAASMSGDLSKEMKDAFKDGMQKELKDM
ncbi:hypothetical protein [Fluviicola chungangensis]|uniref:DUF4190 domain-containing protein n=1 Tax=Fluviicola chungangensis TaxID=2597671 RepID=A0A556N654_9FLAO|nr:hypothetical protein [Fluviicola chungangensis]TSJ47666.1 hypothetical protein FO442_00640 [Fluviicola chungangensis]